MVTFTEATEVYTEYFNVLSKTSSTHTNKSSNAQLNISPISQDRAQEIRNGARAVFGNKVGSLACNIHIKRKHKDKSVINIKNKDKE